jgi:solute carrier family 25 (mitochondrial carnitine/acylcarnitine transporter), member 20/29
VTFFREAVGYAAYFFTYEKLIQRELRQKGIQRNELNLGMSIAYGAAAGYAVRPLPFHGQRQERAKTFCFQLWAVIYPIDVIKSRMQTDGFSVLDGQKYKSTLDCIRMIFRTEGFGAFFRGLTPTLIRQAVLHSLPTLLTKSCKRSPFANGATFLGYEIGARILDFNKP